MGDQAPLILFAVEMFKPKDLLAPSDKQQRTHSHSHSHTHTLKANMIIYNYWKSTISNAQKSGSYRNNEGRGGIQ